MRHAALVTLLAALVTRLAACASPATPPSSPSPPTATTPATAASSSAPEPATAFFPAPYSAAQIRDATRPGRSYTWRVEIPALPASENVTTFTRVDAEGAEITSNGKPRRVTWEELRKHAEFPRTWVTTHDETVTVPAGTFDCIAYVVTDPAAGEVSTFYFAKSLPGAPVLFFSDKAGTRLRTSTLVRYASGLQP
jgi:hypothetical protein